MTRVAATAAALVAVLGGCSGSGDGPEELPESWPGHRSPTAGPAGSDETTGSTGTGIPESYLAGIEDGLERYPDIGSMGMGDISWDCPLTAEIEVDGRSQETLSTTFWKIDDGVHEVACDFYPPVPADLRFALAEDDAAYARLVESTGAVQQSGNEQVESAVTIGGRDLVLVTWEYPTNPAAGTKVDACYLDEELLARACLDVHDADERSEGYDAEQAAQDLVAILDE